MNIPTNFHPIDHSMIQSRMIENQADPKQLESSALASTLRAPNPPGQESSELQQAFQDFVGQTFFGQLIASLRSTQGEAAYFHGGQAEKIFQGQLDQQLAEHLSDSSAKQFADPMFKLFNLRQR